MTPRQTAEQMSPGEFTRLCSILDDTFGKRDQPRTIAFRHGDGSDYQMVAAQTKQVKFEVIAVDRRAVSKKHTLPIVKVCYNGVMFFFDIQSRTVVISSDQKLAA